MPLREGLLEPIPGDNPAGVNLYYDKLFDQLKEARTEDLDNLPAGDWGYVPKKADHALVIKLAGEALAKRTKDLRLAGWLIESQFKREGFSVLVPSLEFLHAFQEKFWDCLFPEIDEDGSLDLRLVAIETAMNRLALALRAAPLTRSGLSLIDYLDSRAVGYESDADNNSQKAEDRQYAIKHGRLTAEDFDSAFGSTPKAFYAGLETLLLAAMDQVGSLDDFQRDRYGTDYPNTGKLRKSLEEVKQIVSALLAEKRKTDPDPVVEPEPEPVEKSEPESLFDTPEVIVSSQLSELESSDLAQAEDIAPRKSAQPATPAKAALTKAMDPYELIVHGAGLLFEKTQESPAPYLVCSGLRLAETRLQLSYENGFAVAPPSEVRQKLVRLSNAGEWAELLRLSVGMLGEEYARSWLDLHRYIWRAAREMGYSAIEIAIVSTVRGVLQDIPDLRHWTLDDDTPAANLETQRWIDSDILPPEPEPEQKSEPEPVRMYVERSSDSESSPEAAVRSVFEIASELLQQGRSDEAIAMMVRDANRQASGRLRFQRRIEVAQLCLACDRHDIAYPILSELNSEIERRELELWENYDLLVKPMTMLLSCMESRGSAQEERDALFARLCRLDPEAALTVRR
jgi:type VI secretion system protein ImpA